MPGAKGILSVIKTTLKGPYPTWTSIPQEKRDELFQEWKKYVKFAPEHENYMRIAFEKHFAVRLPDIYGDIRNRGTKPDWMFNETYAKLLAYWATDKWKKSSSINKKNRASTTGGSLHAAGATSAATLYVDYQKKNNGKAPDAFEMLLLTKRRKKDQTFVDPRAQQTYDNFLELQEKQQSQAGAEDGVASVQLSTDEMLAQAAGGRDSKGRLYSMNYLGGDASYSMTSNFQGQTSSNQSQCGNDEIQQLKENQEKLQENSEKQTEAINRLARMIGGLVNLLGNPGLITQPTTNEEEDDGRRD